MTEEKRTPGMVKCEMGYVGAKHRLFITHPDHDGLLPWSDADARFIEKAWNTHDRLVEALEKIAKLGAGDQYGNSVGNMIAQAALAAAKEAPE